ncbi:MAG: TolC family protein [Desulfovibrionaceae bacterium]|nr:TolC family protein [Desulfovibrionaceae bacterium]
MKRRGACSLAAMALLVCVSWPQVVWAQAAPAEEQAAVAKPQNLEIKHLLRDLLKTHDRVKAAVATLESADHLREKAWGGWYPRLDMSVEAGREEVDKAMQPATSKWRNVETLTATQLLYDFGGTNGNIGIYDGGYSEALSRLEQAKQEVIFQGINAYLRVVRFREMVKYAIKSEESIMELSGMQEALVLRGAGLSYEDLQVKAQLAGAQAHRVNVERELRTAVNNFKAVFGFEITDDEVKGLKTPTVPSEILPAGLEEAIQTAMKDNPFLTELAGSVARQESDLEAKESAFYPKMELVAEGKRKEQDDGADGVRTEGRAHVLMTYNLFSGMSDVESVRAVKSDLVSTRKTILDRRRTIEENVRNAWLNLMTLRKNVELYQNQANITWEFLGLIKKKKAVGAEVNLLDILVGERDYINATSSRVTADVDTIIAGYNLLYQMGKIALDIVAQ